MSAGAIGQSSAPAVTVVVPSHGRPRHVAWLLNELEDQTLGADRFEVVVAHPAGDPVSRVVASHPLGRSGTARTVSVAAGSGRAAARNAGWRAARGPVAAFLHDDCRPPASWLEDLANMTRTSPDAVVEGAVEVDPEQSAFLLARLKRVRRSVPPAARAGACNVAFPLARLRALGGFDERPALDGLDGAETVARSRWGSPHVAAPELVVFHAVRPVGPGAWLAGLASRALGALMAREPGT